MPLFHLFVLSLVQGITEFLPISSSGHLVLTWQVLGSEVPEHDQLIVDIAVHVGTLAAVCGYFRRDIWDMLLGDWPPVCRPAHGGHLAGAVRPAGDPAGDRRRRRCSRTSSTSSCAARR